MKLMIEIELLNGKAEDAIFALLWLSLQIKQFGLPPVGREWLHKDQDYSLTTVLQSTLHTLDGR